MKRPSLPSLASFALFIGLCVSLAYWGLQVMNPPRRVMVAPPAPPPPALAIDSAATLFGGANVAAAASNYQLKGIVADNRGRRSAAILSVNGKPAQAYAVGAEIAPGVTVQEVFERYVLLQEGGAQKRLDLPDPASAPANSVAPVPGAVAPMPAPTFTPPAQPQNSVPPVFNPPPQQGFVPPQATPPAGAVQPQPQPQLPSRPATTTVTPTPPSGVM